MCGACRVLFGPDVDINREFLFYVAPSGVKSAYRKMALVFHPDRAFGKDDATRRIYTERFLRTNLAYERMMGFLRERDVLAVPSERPIKTGPSSPPPSVLPRRRLFIGQFLLYMGVISWEALSRALARQRKQRPRFGELAVGWDWLSDGEVEFALRKKKRGERIGEAAVRLGMLEPFQTRVLTAYQRSRQTPLGAYFVENGYLSDIRLKELVAEFMSHNARFGPSF